MPEKTSDELQSLLQETRSFPPPPDFAQQAQISSLSQLSELRKFAHAEPEAFWSGEARKLAWAKPYKQVLEGPANQAKWFPHGELNLAHNCLDRHVQSGLGDKAALIWEGEPGDKRQLTFSELTREVARFGAALQNLGVKSGDCVAIYMPMIPEIMIATLACARIGAPHNIIFGGFSADALRGRIHDSKARVLITADGGWRRGKIIELKKEADRALEGQTPIEHVIVVKRTQQKINWIAGRDYDWQDLMAKTKTLAPAPPMASEHPLFLLYTSGSTGKPKGILHTTGGYAVGTSYTARIVFDLRPDDIFWCTADLGWVTGHSYVLYGILLNGTTTVMYEGAPDFPHAGRFWEMIDRYKVTKFYTAPTAIRAFMKAGEDIPKKYKLDSLKLLGSVGEPINPEAWMWYRRVIGRDHCPIVDTWWQTETGAIMISPIPGATPTKPGCATLPLPGIEADIVDEAGKSVAGTGGGSLVIKRPWPSMLRGIFGDPERYQKQYWQKFPGMYFAGDGAHRDKDGFYWIMGRIDDVLKVAGHRLGTMDIESALVAHPAVAEAAVVGKPDEVKGQAIVAFVTLNPNQTANVSLAQELKNHVAQTIGAIARPEAVHFTPMLPKTRSGKIMRRLLQELAAKGTASGDQSTLEDTGVLQALQENMQPEEE